MPFVEESWGAAGDRAPGPIVAGISAAVGAVTWPEGAYLWAAALALAILLTYRSYRAYVARIEDEREQIRHLSEVQLAIIEALAQAIEVKDRTTQQHIARLQVYAEGLARSAGMPEDEVRGVKTAALLHDVGNLAVPEHILIKPGLLTDSEFERIKIHPRVGADILRKVPFPYPVASLILHHHERWDGGGYPAGLRETAIPLGARVLAVVDLFAALLSDRPYRRAHVYTDALAVLRENAGAKLDPVLVEKFIEILPRLDRQLYAGDAARAAPQSSPLLMARTTTASTRALDDIAGAHREAQVLYDIAQILGSSLGIDDTVRLISAKLRSLVPFSACALYLWDQEEAAFVCRSADGVAERALHRLRAARVEDLGRLLPTQRSSALPQTPELRSVLSSPLCTGATSLGALAVYDVAPGCYGQEHGRVLDLVTQQAAPVIANLLEFERARHASLTDPLTGLPNRRAMELHLEKELARAARESASLTVLLMDLDVLKTLNDTFGHEIGDAALRQLAAVLRMMLRPYDLCARYGGDEFVVALSNCDAARGERRRRELQEAVCALHVDVDGQHLIELGISAGAATYPSDGTSRELLMTVADQRMYADKAARRRESLFRAPLSGVIP